MPHQVPDNRPLAGLRVVDIATYIAAPYCATLMAEFGAEVIKVEQPTVGDPCRRLGPSPSAATRFSGCRRPATRSR